MAKFPAPAEGIVLTHFIIASNVGRSRRFYAGVLGGEVLRDGEPSIVALANSWIIINAGGPPTDDKPTVTLEPHWLPGLARWTSKTSTIIMKATYRYRITWSGRVKR
jgi:hypothetical protein